MRVVSIIGLLGAGKSSVVRYMLHEAARRGLSAGAVVNDSGEVALDVPELTDRHAVRKIGGGWIGCTEAGSFATVLKELARVEQLDIALSEPSGLVIPGELRNAIRVAGRDARIEVGPIVLLLDGSDPKGAFAEGVDHLTTQQAAQADAIAVSQTDRGEEDGLDALEARAREVNDDVPYFRISVVEDAGMDDLVTYLLGGTQADKEVPKG